MGKPGEVWFRRAVLKVAREVEKKYGVPPDIQDVYSVLDSFMKYNPGVDPESIDWTCWDPRLPLSEVYRRLEEKYPGYVWRPPEEKRREEETRTEDSEEDIIDIDLEPLEMGEAKSWLDVFELELARERGERIGLGGYGCTRCYRYDSDSSRAPAYKPVRSRRREEKRWKKLLVTLYRLFIIICALPAIILFYSRD
jgi:hypothetical protein